MNPDYDYITVYPATKWFNYKDEYYGPGDKVDIYAQDDIANIGASANPVLYRRIDCHSGKDVIYNISIGDNWIPNVTKEEADEAVAVDKAEAKATKKEKKHKE